jgi:hypothetical protein
VAGAIPVAEAVAGDEAAPPLLSDGGAHEGRGVGQRDSEEDLLDELVRQRCWRRRTHSGPRRWEWAADLGFGRWSGVRDWSDESAKEMGEIWKFDTQLDMSISLGTILLPLTIRPLDCLQQLL